MAGRKPAIELEGNREFRRALRRTGNDVKDDLKSLHREGANIVLQESLRRVPVRTGTLKATVRAAALQTRGEVRAGFKRVPYAGPIHFGWPAQRIRPNPFLYDAIDARRSEVLDAYHQGVDRAARRHGLDVRRSLRG